MIRWDPSIWNKSLFSKLPADDGMWFGALLHLITLICHQHPGYESLLQVRRCNSISEAHIYAVWLWCNNFREWTLYEGLGKTESSSSVDIKIRDQMHIGTVIVNFKITDTCWRLTVMVYTLIQKTASTVPCPHWLDHRGQQLSEDPSWGLRSEVSWPLSGPMHIPEPTACSARSCGLGLCWGSWSDIGPTPSNSAAHMDPSHPSFVLPAAGKVMPKGGAAPDQVT